MSSWSSIIDQISGANQCNLSLTVYPNLGRRGSPARSALGRSTAVQVYPQLLWVMLLPRHLVLSLADTWLP